MNHLFDFRSGELCKVYRYTYQDWLRGRLPWGLFQFQFGQWISRRKRPYRRVFVLEEGEYVQILNHCKVDLEHYVELHLNQYKHRFEQRYVASQQPVYTLQVEIQLIQQILHDPDEMEKVAIFDEGRQIHAVGSRKSKTLIFGYLNEVAYWYQRLVVQQDYREGIVRLEEPLATNQYFAPAFALIFHHYLKYLQAFKRNAPAAPLDSIFRKHQYLEEMMQALAKMNIIDHQGQWQYGRKVGAIMPLVQVLKRRGKVKTAFSDYELAQAIAEHLGTKIQPRTTRDRPQYYEALQRQFLLNIPR